MAELLGKPYSYIMAVAIFPALIYFLSVFAMIHFEALKNGIQGLQEKIENHLKGLKQGAHHTIPLLLILVLRS